MTIPYIINPLDDPLFIPVVIRLIFCISFMFLFVIIANIRDILNIFKSEEWKKYYVFILFAPIYIIVLFCGIYAAMTIIGILIIFSLYEFRRISQQPTAYYIASLALVVITVYISFYQTRYFFSLPLLYLIALAIMTIALNDPKRYSNHLFYSFFANMWITFFLAHMILIYAQENREMLIFIIFAVYLGDSLAYYLGRFFNKIRLLDRYFIASRISPKKTFIGTIGNIAGVSIGVYLSHFVNPMLDTYQLIILIIMITIGSIIGDFIGSAVKRAFKVKDSSLLQKGDYGILDALDGTIITSVFLYYFIILFV